MDKLISQSRTTEVADASMRMDVAFRQTGLQTDTPLIEIYADLNSKTVRLSAALRRAKSESELEAKDEIRDDKLRSLYYLITGYLHHPDPLVKAAAVAITRIFDNYGLKITEESYASESALITSWLMELGNPDNQESFGEILVWHRVSGTVSSSTGDFENTRVNWEKDKAKEGALENASELKKAVIAIINDRLVVYLRAMQQVNPAMFGEFADTIAVIIAENNETVKRRREKPEPEVAPGQ